MNVQYSQIELDIAIGATLAILFVLLFLLATVVVRLNTIITLLTEAQNKDKGKLVTHNATELFPSPLPLTKNIGIDELLREIRETHSKHPMSGVDLKLPQRVPKSMYVKGEDAFYPPHITTKWQQTTDGHIVEKDTNNV